MLEIAIFQKFLNDRDCFDKYAKYLDTKSIDYELRSVLKTIKQLYLNYPEKKSISVAELSIFFFSEYPHIKDKDLYKQLFHDIKTITVSSELTTSLINKFIRKDFTNRIIDIGLPLLSNVDDIAIFDKFDNIITEYRELTGRAESESVFFESSLSDLLTIEDDKKGLDWRLKELTNTLQKLRGGRLGHIFAPVDTGKTTFLLSELSNFAYQIRDTDKCIIWFNNEERKTKLRLRLYSAVLGAGEDVIRENVERAESAFIERGGNKILFYDSGSISFQDITHLVKKHRPLVIAIDQGDKVTYKSNDNREQQLRVLYQAYRELAKEYNCDILTFGQANEKAFNRRWLLKNHMDYSKVGKPGELDFAIGINSNQDSPNDMTRFISICKNKDGGQARIIATMNPITVRYEDI